MTKKIHAPSLSSSLRWSLLMITNICIYIYIFIAAFRSFFVLLFLFNIAPSFSSCSSSTAYQKKAKEKHPAKADKKKTRFLFFKCIFYVLFALFFFLFCCCCFFFSVGSTWDLFFFVSLSLSLSLFHTVFLSAVSFVLGILVCWFTAQINLGFECYRGVQDSLVCPFSLFSFFPIVKYRFWLGD